MIAATSFVNLGSHRMSAPAAALSLLSRIDEAPSAKLNGKAAIKRRARLFDSPAQALCRQRRYYLARYGAMP